MKKFYALTLALILALCSSFATATDIDLIDLSTLTDKELQSLQSSIAKEIDARELAAASSEANGAYLAEGTIGEYWIGIKGARAAENRSKEDCIVIEMDWSHTRSESESFLFSFSVKAFQGGIELETAYGASDSSNSSLDIKSGAVLDVEKGYILRNATDPVEVEITESFSFSSNSPTVTHTFSLPL